MYVDTIVIKNKVTRLEITAHYSGDYNYGLSSGESCYSAVVDFCGCEYIVGISRDYSAITQMADHLTELMKYPLAINRVTKLRNDSYNIVRDSVCVNAFNRSLENSSLRSLSLDDLDDYEIDFDITEQSWDKKN